MREQSYDEALRGSDREAEFWNGSSCDGADAGVKLIRALGVSQVGHVDKMKLLKKA